ncbi:HAD-like protein [Aureobasidium pullulans]|nr:HAD-like protein [Aureobasidium pullulans]
MPIRIVLFDFMGTCLDWHSSIIAALPQDIPEQDRSSFALQWRQTYFDANTQRISDGLPTENIDVTHSKTWDQMLTVDSFANYLPLLEIVGVKDRCITAWHSQQAWPDVAPALQRLHVEGYEVVVHANGTTRLQLDLCRSSGLQFDALFSSQLLGAYKPAKGNYLKVLELLQRGASECVIVAAHAYDLRGAKAVGMKTVYVYRWTDDVKENQEVVKMENEAWLENMDDIDQVIGSL